MMVYKCDRCECIYERPETSISERYEITYGIGNYDDPQGSITCDALDLCPSCYNSFLEWLNRWQRKDVSAS